MIFYKTNLNIDYLFHGELNIDDIDTVIKIRLSDTKLICLHIKKGGLEILPLSEILNNIDISEGKCYIYEEITPASHLRDYEIIPSGENREKAVIDEDEAICVIIVEPLGCYVKLYYEKGKILPIFTVWNHSWQARKILNSDLSLGYDILFVRDRNKPIRLCEELDKRDE